jgi:hypothetical protein
VLPRGSYNRTERICTPPPEEEGHFSSIAKRMAGTKRKRSLFKTPLRVLQTNAPWFLVYLIGGLYIFGIFRIFKVARSSCSAC